MNITGKVSAGMTNVVTNMKNGVNNCKVDGKIAEQEKRIKVLIREIGNLALVRLEAGDEMSPEIMERYAAIKEAKEIIANLEGEIVKTKVVCPNCGKKTSAEMKYCGACGTSLRAEKE